SAHQLVAEERARRCRVPPGRNQPAADLVLAHLAEPLRGEVPRGERDVAEEATTVACVLHRGRGAREPVGADLVDHLRPSGWNGDRTGDHGDRDREEEQSDDESKNEHGGYTSISMMRLITYDPRATMKAATHIATMPTLWVHSGLR